MKLQKRQPPTQKHSTVIKHLTQVKHKEGADFKKNYVMPSGIATFLLVGDYVCYGLVKHYKLRLVQVTVLKGVLL